MIQLFKIDIYMCIYISELKLNKLQKKDPINSVNILFYNNQLD